jgi:acyl-CoA synthetase (AMP-forming)/AMP-acid ligase II
MYLTQGVHRSVQINGSRTATSFKGRKQNWREFADRVARLAGALRALGVGPGDRVSMLAHNSDRYVEHYYAVFWIGAVAVPVNTRWSMAEILYSLDDSTPSVLLFDDAFIDHAASLRDEAQSLQHCIYAGEATAPDWALDYERLVADTAPIEDIRHGGEALAAIMYTGGTTGFPKGVMLSHAGLVSNVLAMASLTCPGARSVILHAAPLFHMAAAAMMFTTTVFGGCHSVIPGFVPASVCEAIAADRVTDVLLVPTMVKMLIDHCDANSGDLSSIRSLLYGASPMPEPVLRRAIAAMPDARFFHAYGQTELSPGATMLHPDYQRLDGDISKLRSAGQALPGIDVKIASDDGTELARGEVGEVWVRGPNTLMGYWNKPDVTAATIVDSWVRTGDAAYMDPDGFLFIVDRVKDMIISGGENVYSAEVENAVLKHPAIADCAVIGVPDDQWGERVHAIIVPRAGQDIALDVLIAHCKTLIAGYKCPRSCDVREEPLPLSAAGKVLKTELRAPYWAKQDAA